MILYNDFFQQKRLRRRAFLGLIILQWILLLLVNWVSQTSIWRWSMNKEDLTFIIQISQDPIRRYSRFTQRPNVDRSLELETEAVKFIENEANYFAVFTFVDVVWMRSSIAIDWHSQPAFCHGQNTFICEWNFFREWQSINFLIILRWLRWKLVILPPLLLRDGFVFARNSKRDETLHPYQSFSRLYG